MKTSINFKPVKSDSEIHNYRKKTFDYIRKDLTSKNEYWVQESIKVRLEKIENYCKEKSGRKLQKNAMPIREAVVVIKETTTLHELHLLAKKMEVELKIRIFQIAIHKDEGHFDKDSKEWKPNYHAHLVADWQDVETGKTLKHQGFHYSKMQDITAECLGMERGVSGGKQRLEALEFKIHKKEEELKELDLKIDKIKKELNSDKANNLIISKTDFLGFKKIETDKTIENFQTVIKTNNIEASKSKDLITKKDDLLQTLNDEVKFLKEEINNLKKRNSLMLVNIDVLKTERLKYLNEIKFTLERKIESFRFSQFYPKSPSIEKLNSDMESICKKMSNENSIPIIALEEIFKSEKVKKELYSLLQFGHKKEQNSELKQINDEKRNLKR